MEKINFAHNWQEMLKTVYTFRYTDTPTPKQLCDCIEGGINKDHPEGFDNIGFLSNNRYTAPVDIKLTWSFMGEGCPEIIIVPGAEECPDGVTRYGECFEIVLYKGGVNVWRHYREDGKCFWHKRLGALFPVEENKKHLLEVTVKESYIDISVDGMVFSLRTDDLPKEFNVGFAVCEGIVKLYEARINNSLPSAAGGDKELELMGEFFDKRLEGYDEHMLRDIELSEQFYPYTASLLPMTESVSVLDLGCGTGLELEEYFSLNPTAKVTGIDLAPGMLGELKRKLSAYNVTTILGSYFDVPFEAEAYDAAVSVESLHHFTKKAKTELYRKLLDALKPGGYFILTDYIIDSDEEEEAHMNELNRLRGLQGKHDGKFYHYDTPLTLQHECEALREAGFESVEVLRNFGHTRTIRAIKQADSN